jgi:hypothetical protein
MLLVTKFSWNVCKKLWERKVEIKGNRWMMEKIPLIEEVGWREGNQMNEMNNPKFQKLTHFTKVAYLFLYFL